jgi:predicted amidohydrolase
MVSTPRVDDNLAAADRLIGEAAAAGAQWVGLPEYFCLMGQRDTDKVDQREALESGPIQSFLADAARRHQVWLAGGTLPLVAPTPDKVLNTTLVFDPDGRRVARYDKIHLFGFTKGSESYDEGRTITPGADVSVAETPFGRIGLSICYDLRFPELYRKMGQVGLLMVPAAFTYTTGRAHWEILLRARAIENQCYVLAPAQGGIHENGRRTWGHTMLIDPWGEIVAERTEDGEGIVVGDIDVDHVASIRESLPALRHRTM